MRELIIPRDTWLRGKGGENSGLLVWGDRGPVGLKRTQCCIGIDLTALGVPDQVLEYRGSTDEVLVTENHTDFKLPKEAEWQVEKDDQGLYQASNLVAAMYRINDDVNLTEVAREDMLRALFMVADPPIRVTFVDTLEEKK